MLDRQTLYDSLRRNQLFCPDLTCSIMTAAFMKGCIGSRLWWLPHTSDVKFKNAVDCPSRQELA